MSRRSRPLLMAAILLAVLVASSLIILVSGIAIATFGQASKVVAVVAIICGGSLTAWHTKALISGAGRTHQIITSSQWISLTIVGIFALVAGFGVFDLLGGQIDATRIVLSIAGVSGLAAAIIETVRNTESETEAESLNETTEQAEVEEPIPQIEILDMQAAESDVEMTMIVSVPEARARRAAQDMDDLTWLYDSVPEPSETTPKRARRAL